jgi:hypothetical protein
LKIIDEDWLLDLFLTNGTEFIPLVDHVQIELLSLSGMKRLFEEMTYSKLTESIWNGFVRRFTNVDNDQGRLDRWINTKVFESTIVSEFPAILQEFRTSRIEMLYRGTRDGFGSADFHGKCDGHGNTITLIRTTKDFIFGGYTPLSWDSSNAYKTDSSHQSFVFTISNPHQIGSRKFRLKPDQAHSAIGRSKVMARFLALAIRSSYATIVPQRITITRISVVM